jgi:hypothetical protein
MSYFEIQLVPGEDAEPFDQVIQLEGSKYLFRFRWADRASAWLLSIHDDQDVELVAGQALVNTSDLLRPFNDARLPPGQLSVVDVDGLGLDAGKGDLGGRVQLFYADSDAVAAVIAELFT